MRRSIFDGGDGGVCGGDGGVGIVVSAGTLRNVLLSVSSATLYSLLSISCSGGMVVLVFSTVFKH